ncbi:MULTISPECIES: ParB/RepB/Spo0J family partition protein [Sphingomonadales]|uniref:Chromosome partitioning protein ParB n=1 Tax=Sphingopyxis macrogoltabida TaxID=33050 RepID=A0AAC9AUC0_SPHMC|nr:MULTISPECIES: ParB/RepB/Spo0J family partition protein [Sphingomonadaceae]ALJ12255.1 plasmid partitioning protein ParB [Sphingopyxis macrogoltabida]AMU88427.1 chromosome partitioning protein ParB [Sphingopyxis macrogoltabida]MBF7011900.1 ParB/RepB/Spo0J family partition protein [Novosphingobium sp. HR1a]PEQ10792.1 chromosome partitioning protein ParB [Novosphingobium sp. PC22D]WJM26652.1 ParB/RepB/Spo0J family partition protein [Novosphingobium resinovorum]
MIKSIPLTKLVQSPRNVRRHGDPAADSELKASIAAHGLLQNLIVRPAARGKFEVEAGERRRCALLALAEERVLPKGYEVTCLVLEDDAEIAVETSLAENFHRLAMNPADEAQAFAALIEAGASTEDVARRFGLTVRFVEGRLRLATLAPVVFDALASGEITLDLAKAFGATSDQEIQARVYEQASSGYYAPSADSIRRMVLSGTVRGSDARARLVGRDAYTAAGGRIERELFDDDDSESWVDVALLETLASEEMEKRAKALAAEQGLAWVKPTLDAYASHDLVEGLIRLPAEPAPLTDAELARLDELDASYDDHAAILEDEDSAEEAIAAAEATIEAIERECQDIRAKPPELAPELKANAGMILVLSRDGTPVLQPVFYGERDIEVVGDDDVVEVVASVDSDGKRRAALSKRLIDELAMQRRDVLALHVASDPGLSLDIMVFTLADADTHDWRSRAATTLRGGVPAGPIVGFEAKDAPASASLADLRSGLDESWRSGEDASSRFKMFRALADESRAAWLGFVVARTLEASLNMAGERQIAFQDHLGSAIGIDMAQWWRPTAANYFDRVSKQVILDALTDVGGLELSSRFASVKKGDLAMSAERVFAGTYITEVEVRERALAWVPEVMRFADLPEIPADNEAQSPNADFVANDDNQPPSELAA